MKAIKTILAVIAGTLLAVVVLGLVVAGIALVAFLATFGWLIVGGIIVIVICIAAVREALG